MTKVESKHSKMQTPKNAFVSGVALCSTVLALLSGCAKSDPTSEYSAEIATAVPLKDRKIENQAVLDQLVVIDTERVVTAVEGKTVTFKIRALTNFKVDSFGLKISGLPTELGEAKVDRSTSEANTYLVTIAIPAGFIPPSQGVRTVPYKVEMVDVRSSDAKVEALYKSVAKYQEGAIAVQREGKAPEITKIPQGLEEVAQGAVASFSVDVIDLASSENNPPRVDVYFQGTNRTESGYEANGATYVRVDALPKYLGNNQWRFSFLFDAKNNEVGAQLDREGKRIDGATHLNTRMYIKAYGVNGATSGDQLVTAKIKFTKPQVGVLKTQDECKAFAEEEAKAKKEAAAKAKADAAAKAKADAAAKKTAAATKK